MSIGIKSVFFSLKIIVNAFYIPPRLGTKALLFNHLLAPHICTSLKSPCAGFPAGNSLLLMAEFLPKAFI